MADEKTSEPTHYLILKRVTDETMGAESAIGEEYVIVGSERARGDIAAIRAFHKGKEPKIGETFVAVPLRSWKPRTARERDVPTSLVFG